MRRSNLVSVVFKSHTVDLVPNGVATANAFAYSLDNFSGVDPFKTMYDMFRIRKIKYTWKPRGSVVNLYGSGNTNGVGGAVISALDFNDSTAWVDIASGVNAWGARRTPVQNGFKLYFTPRVLDAFKLQTGSATMVDIPRVAPWISTTAGATAHYGIKYITIMGGTVATTTQVDVWADIYVQFKHRTGTAPASKFIHTHPCTSTHPDLAEELSPAEDD